MKEVLKGLFGLFVIIVGVRLAYLIWKDEPIEVTQPESFRVAVLSTNCSYGSDKTVRFSGEIKNIGSDEIESLRGEVIYRGHGKIIDQRYFVPSVENLKVGAILSFNELGYDKNNDGVEECEITLSNNMKPLASSGGITQLEKTYWKTIEKIIPDVHTKHLCAASRCGGFKLTLLKRGVTKELESRIYKLEFKEIIPGDRDNKHPRCSLYHTSYDPDFKAPENIHGSISSTENCSFDDPIWGGNGMTFNQKLGQLGFKEI